MGQSLREDHLIPSFLARFVCSTFLSPLPSPSHEPSCSPFPTAEEVGHLLLPYLAAPLGEVAEDGEEFCGSAVVKIGSHSSDLCFKLALA